MSKYQAEVEGKDQRMISAMIQQITVAQSKRKTLLDSESALTEYARRANMPVEEMRNIIESNYLNNMPRLESYRVLIDYAPKANTTGIVFKDISPPVDADYQLDPESEKESVNNNDPMPSRKDKGSDPSGMGM